MKKGSGNMEEGGLQFFGKVTASISHEIRNVLAIINENAGLLEDLTIMAEKGRPLESDRLKILAGKVRDQVIRGDGIVQNMNRFAHSVDRRVEEVDLVEILNLMADLARRLAFMKGVSLEAKASNERIMITTKPFLLENLIWDCLSLAIKSEPLPKIIGLVPEVGEKGTRIRLTGLPDTSQLTEGSFLKDIGEIFMEELEGNLSFDPESGEILIGLPKSISPD